MRGTSVCLRLQAGAMGQRGELGAILRLGVESERYILGGKESWQQYQQ